MPPTTPIVAVLTAHPSHASVAMQRTYHGHNKPRAFLTFFAFLAFFFTWKNICILNVY